MTHDDAVQQDPTSIFPDPVGATDPPDDDDPAQHDGPASSVDIEDCLRRLDELWPPDEDPAPVGPRQLGRFTILGELGRGGFGVVFLADDPLLGRRVALKVPRVEILAGSQAWRRFTREARAASQLDHANLVPLLEAGAIGPVGYIISAFVAGPSLEHWLRRQPHGAPPRWTARLVATLARAMAYVHQQGIQHCDLKPANVLLHAQGLGNRVDVPSPEFWQDVELEDWVPRICDFGLAKLREIDGNESRSQFACGSPPYMAPEQAEARQADIGPRTDIYGLGAILYQLLAGRPPFSGKSELETLRRVVADEPVPPRRLRAEVPRDLETICLKCLAKKPGERYQEVTELAEELERFLDGRPIKARPVAAWERGWKWARRNPTAAILAAVVVMAILGSIGGMFGYQSLLLRHNDELQDKNQKLRRSDERLQENIVQLNAALEGSEEDRSTLARQLAGSQIFSAKQAESSGNFERARRLLEIAGPEFGPPDARSFPWRYLNQSVRDHIEVFAGHASPIMYLASSHDGRTLASGDGGGQIRLWDLPSGRCRLVLSASNNAMEQLAFSPDGTSLASVERTTGLIRLWELPSGRCRGTLEGTGLAEPIRSLFFEAEGRRIGAIRARRDPMSSPLTCWDLTRSDGVLPEVTLGEQAGSALQAKDDRLQYLSDLLDGIKPSGSSTPAESSEFLAHATTRGVVVTRDNALAIVGQGDGTFAVFRKTTWSRLAVIRGRPQGNIVVFFDPSRVEGAFPRELRKRLERLAAGLIPGWIEKSTLRGFVAWSEIYSPIAFSPDRRQLAFWEEAPKRLSLIDLDTGRAEAISELGPLSGIRALCFSPDGATLAVASSEDKLVRIWHRRPPRRMTTLPGHAPKEAWSMAFAPDRRTLATGGDDGLIRLWDLATKTQKSKLRGHYALVSALAYTPDGLGLISGSFYKENRAMVWDIATGRPRCYFRGHTDRVRSLVVSPDGRRVISAGDDSTIMIWDPADGRRLGSIQDVPRGGSVATSPDGRTIVFSAGVNRIVLIDETDGTSRSIRVDDPAGSFAFSRDGSRLHTGHGGGTIRTWELSTLRPVRVVDGHAGQVLGLALSPDGTTLASAGEDKTVRLWDTASGQELMCFADFQARVNSVAFSPDGLTLAAADHTGAVTLWTIEPGN
jgi:eukaryotic-like serine/threonine-protein kinase